MNESESYFNNIHLFSSSRASFQTFLYSYHLNKRPPAYFVKKRIPTATSLLLRPSSPLNNFELYHHLLNSILIFIIRCIKISKKKHFRYLKPFAKIRQNLLQITNTHPFYSDPPAYYKLLE